MNYKTATLLLCSSLLFLGCSQEEKKQVAKEPLKIKEFTAVKESVKAPLKEVTQEKLVIKKENYTIDEIYNAMCIQCHSADGSGNTEKLTPSMRDLSQQEMFDELKNVEDDKGHVIMEHNRGKIVEMGMEYSAHDMSEYMFKRFNQEQAQE